MHVNKDSFSSDSSKIPESKAKEVSPKDAKAGEVGKRTIRKAREVEDLRSQKPVRARSLSLPPLEGKLNAKEVAAECAKRSADGMWVCVERRPNKLGGYIYVFRVKDEYDIGASKTVEEKNVRAAAASKQVEKQFPAVEPNDVQLASFKSFKGKEEEQNYIQKTIDYTWSSLEPELIKQFMGNPKESIDFMISEIKTQFYESQKKLWDYQFAIGPSLQKIGYRLVTSDKGSFFEVPDRDALRANWEKFRNDKETKETGKSQLPPLDIISSEGIAGDLEFVESYFCNHALLSEGVEFLHDHFAHILPALTLMINAEESGEKISGEKFVLVKSALVAYKRIWIAKRELEDNKLHATAEQLKLLEQNIKKTEAVLGAFVDTLSSISAKSLVPTSYDMSLQSTYNTIGALSIQWTQYMINRFYPKELEDGGPEDGQSLNVMSIHNLGIENSYVQRLIKFENQFNSSIQDTWKLFGVLEEARKDSESIEARPGVMSEKVKEHALEMSLGILADYKRSVDDVWAELNKIKKLPLESDDLITIIYRDVAHPSTRYKDSNIYQSLLFHPLVMDFLIEQVKDLPDKERFKLTEKMVSQYDGNNFLVLQHSAMLKAMLPLLTKLRPEELVELLTIKDRDYWMVFDERDDGQPGLSHVDLFDLFDRYAAEHSEEEIHDLLDAKVRYLDESKGRVAPTEALIDKVVRMKGLHDEREREDAKFDFFGFSGGGKLPPPGPAFKAVLEKYYPDKLKALFP